MFKRNADLIVWVLLLIATYFACGVITNAYIAHAMRAH